MMQAFRGMACWIAGHKRFQSAGRAAVPLFEAEDRWLKVNPLCNWTARDIDAHLERYDLPRHPLQERGFASISCAEGIEAVRTKVARRPDDLQEGGQLDAIH